ncbi:MAG: type II toxin-antitoxin system RelE/ParE family toxin [Vulcanimicrobiaceae bacterium]
MEFRGEGTRDAVMGRDTRAARLACPVALWVVARLKLDQLATTSRLENLRVPPGNRLEALRGNRAGQHSIRINDQYRVCFRWDPQAGATEVEIVDYH